MTKIFRKFPSRIDRGMVVFSAMDASLKPDFDRLICCNAYTHVTETKAGSMAVPTHAANDVAAFLAEKGWTEA